MIRKFVSPAVALGAVAIVACSARENVGQGSEKVDYVCSEAASATLDGIPAYAYCGDFNVWSNNGADTKSTSGGSGWIQTEGGYGYQCVEYAVRYLHFKFGTGTLWGISYAKQMCATHPSNVSVTTTPVHGDLIIFAGGSCGADVTAGHVAVVDKVNATTVDVVQENVAGKYTYKQSCASCFLHAAGNTGVADPCAGAPLDGFYCGQSTQWPGGTKDDLYDCEGGATKTKTTCAHGCIVETSGTNDKCADPPADAGSDAANDAAPATDSGAKADASPPPPQDAGTGAGGSNGCNASNAPAQRGDLFFAPLAIAALAIARRPRRAKRRATRPFS